MPPSVPASRRFSQPDPLPIALNHADLSALADE
jgi:hypothetical protein